jgi:hypothetical protein
VLVIQLENFSQVDVIEESRFSMSMGLKDAAPSLTSAETDSISVGTKFKAEDEANPVREKVEAVFGAENASELETKRAKTIEQVIFMLFVVCCG